MDNILKLLLKHIPSFIKDTRDFLTIFNSHTHLHEDEFLVTIDVSALYTSIPHEEGIEAVKLALTSHPSPIMNPDTAATLVNIWSRFIDDIFAIYRCTEDELQNHLDYLNTVHNDIKFTYEFSREYINFLDTTVYVDQNRKLHTKVFRTN